VTTGAKTLLLLSEQLDPADAVVGPRLVDLWRGRCLRVAYLPSAPDPQRTWFEPQRRSYAALGASLEYFGLEESGDATRVNELFERDAIHLSGGNTFRFLHWLRAHQLVERLRDYARNGGTLIGVSAGSILMTPDIGTASLCGDQRVATLEDDTGLDLVSFLVRPHFIPSESASAELHATARRYRRAVYAIPDGAAILIARGRTHLLGAVTVVDS